MHKPPENVREKLLQERINNRLNTISDASFQRVLDNLPTYEAHILSNIRQQAKKRERTQELERERNRTFDRSR